MPGRCSDRTPPAPRPSGCPGRVPPRDLGRPNLRARPRGWASSLAAAPGSRTGPGAVTFTAPQPGRLRNVRWALPSPFRREAGDPGPGVCRALPAADTHRAVQRQAPGAQQARHSGNPRHVRPPEQSVRPAQTAPAHVAAPGVLRRRARSLRSPHPGSYVAAPGVLRRRARETGQRRACAEGLAGGGSQGTWSASSRPEVSWRLGVFSGSPDFSSYPDSGGFFWRLRQFCETVPGYPSRCLSGTEREFRYRAVGRRAASLDRCSAVTGAPSPFGPLCASRGGGRAGTLWSALSEVERRP